MDMQGAGDRPEATFVALADGEVVAYAKLSLSLARPTVAMHDITGVMRAWRGRGIAGALKAAEIAGRRRAATSGSRRRTRSATSRSAGSTSATATSSSRARSPCAARSAFGSASRRPDGGGVDGYRREVAKRAAGHVVRVVGGEDVRGQ